MKESYNNYLLTDEEVKNLSFEEQIPYTEFIRLVSEKGVVYKNALEKWNNVLEQEYNYGVINNRCPDLVDKYLIVLGKNVEEHILKKIADIRNEAVSCEREIDQYNFNNILHGLDVLTNFINMKLESCKYNKATGSDVLKSVLDEIKDLKKQIEIDVKYFNGFLKEKESAYSEYELKKAAYDKLSLFGKIAAKVNGKQQEIEESRNKVFYYGSKDVRKTIDDNSMIKNTSQYTEYLENQQILNEEGKSK